MFINEEWIMILKGLIGIIRKCITYYETDCLVLGMIGDNPLSDEKVERLKLIESYLCKAHNLLKRM